MNRKWKVSTVVFLALLVMMLAALPFVVPSGAITVRAQTAYDENIYLLLEEEGDSAEEILEEDVQESGARLVLNASGGSAPEAAALPMGYTPGLTPNPAGFTENGYEDASIAVALESREVDGSMFHIARVKIAHPSQLRTALAGPYGTKNSNRPSTMAQKNNAVVAINGDYFINRDGGYIIRQGQFHRAPSSERGTLHVLAIDSRGDFHILVNDRFKQFMALRKDESNPLLQVFTFGPALVMDGAVQPMPKEYKFDFDSRNPRTAIGQTGPLQYVLVLVEGRSENSPGVTTEALASFMAEIGCTQAFNLDGGNSSVMVFNNNIYAKGMDNKERPVSDIIYFASAVDPASWQ